MSERQSTAKTGTKSKKTQSGQTKKTQTKSGGTTGIRGTKQRKRSTRRRSGGTVMLAALLVALLLLLGALVFFLYQAGFFQPMSDEELLGVTSTREMVETFSSANGGEVQRFVLTGDGNLTLEKPGDTLKLQYELEPAGAEVLWSSDDEHVATVDPDGTVTAQGEGTCTITGTAGGITVTAVLRCGE